MYLFCLLINQIFFYYVHVCWHFAEFRLAVVQLHVSGEGRQPLQSKEPD